jgi:hypothetical protein
MTSTILSGRKEIQSFVGRRWDVIAAWIKGRSFPAEKIDGRWESDTDLVLQWRRDQIVNTKQRPKKGVKRG